VLSADPGKEKTEDLGAPIIGGTPVPFEDKSVGEGTAGDRVSTTRMTTERPGTTAVPDPTIGRTTRREDIIVTIPIPVGVRKIQILEFDQ
jgi:hypothetical protein